MERTFMSYLKGLKDCFNILILIFSFLLLTIILFFITSHKIFIFLSFVLIIKLIFVLHFFRNPDREIVQGDNLILSPADGKVISITDEFEPLYLKDKAHRIVIFMNIFNVHRNRIPVDGKIDYLKYYKGKFLAAFKKNVEEANERMLIGIKSKKFKILFKQIAGLIARRIVCNLKIGDKVKAGEIFGMIRFGSALIIYIPLKFKLKIIEGEKVKAGLTVLASL